VLEARPLFQPGPRANLHAGLTNCLLPQRRWPGEDRDTATVECVRPIMKPPEIYVAPYQLSREVFRDLENDDDRAKQTEKADVIMKPGGWRITKLPATRVKHI
jgi:hypothetical protein